MKMGWVRAGLMMAAVAGMATGIPATADDYTPPKIYTVTPTGVNLSDGSYTFSDTDLSIGPLTLERFYISGKRDPNTKFFGPRITSNFDIYVAKNVRAPINPFVLPRRYAPIVHIGSSSVGVYAQSADAANQPIYFGNVDSQSGQLSQASGVYTFIAQDGTIYTFGGPGAAGMANSQRVTSIAFPDGRTQSFSYNGSGQLKMVADSSGYALVFDYDGSGLTSAACAFNLSQTYVTATATCTGAALKTSYAYTGGLLTSVTDVAGQVTTYTYPTNQLCIKPPGYSVCKVSTTFQSTKPWIVSQQTLADGSVWNFSITGDSENARSPEPSYVEDPTNGGTVTDPNGKVSYYGFSKTSPYTMTDSNGRTTKYRYTGGYENEWSLYTNNPPDRAEGSLLTEADFPDGSKYLAQYTGLNVVYKQTWVAKPLSGLADRVVEYGYPSCPSGFGPTCAKPISKKDPKGNQTDYAYTSFGATQSEMLPAPTAGGARPLKLYTYVQKYAYVKNSGGTLVQATAQIWVPDTVTECQTVASSTPAAACDPSAAQRVTAYQYGADGTANNLLMRGMVVTANIGSTPTSYRTCFSYDARGRKISTTTPRGTNTGGMLMMRRALRCFTILIVTIVPATALAQSSPSNFTSAVRYDDRNRVTGTIAPDDDGAAPFSYLATRTTYNDINRKVTVETGALSSWQSDTIAPSAWSGFTLFSKVETQNDLLDRKAVEAAWAWDASLTAPAWVQKTLTQYSYDPVGRPECVAVRIDPATWASLPASACTLATSGTAANPDRITKTVYDDAGQVLKVVKALGTPLQQDYVTYTYSATGKPLSVKDANGNLAGYTYDGHNRLITWSFPDKTATGSVSTSDYEAYTYDLNGNRETMRKRDGRTFTYYYDNLNRMTAKIVPDSCVGDYACTTPPADATRDVYYGYDARGQQLFAAFNAATGTDRIDNDYDGFGRLRSQITAMYGVSRTVSYLYDADGNRVRITHPDSVYFTTDYDGLDRATAVKENGSTTIASMTYDAQGREGSETRDTVTTTFGYDGIGRLSSLADDLPGGTTNDIATTFDYNYASQLTSRIRSNPSPYAWGGYGIISRSYTANGLNQYAGSVSTVSGETMAPVAYGYDANGNLVSTGTESYGYDAENRLVTDSAGGGTTFAYDPLGRLYGYGGTASKSSVYDGDQRIVDYTANASVIQQRYVMGPGTDNPLVWYYGAGLSDRRSLQADERGSIVSAVDATGTLIGINSYDEYGVPAASNTGRYGYTGQVWIATLGMWYYKARFYSPSLGRFMQTDPIGYADQNNLYAYVGNDPMDGVDPSGLFGYLNGGEGCPAGSSCTTTDLAATSEAINRGSASSGQAQSPNTKSQLGEGGPDGPKPGIGHNGGPPIEGTGGRLLGRLLGAVGAIITDILFPDPAGPPKEGIGPYVAANGTQVSGRFPIKSSPNAMLYRMSNGKITNYQTYDKSGYPRLRVDLAGKSHARIATPHAVEYTVYIGPNGQVSVNPGPTRPTNLLELP